MWSSGCRLTITQKNIFLTQQRTTFTEKYKHGPTRLLNRPKPYVRWARDFFGPEGWQFTKDEIKRLVLAPTKWKWRKFYELNKTYKFEEFTEESIKRWRPKADSDSLNGFSHCTVVRSPSGHALFKGVLDNRLPDDGVTGKSGFVAMLGPMAPRMPFTFHTDTSWDWREFNTLEIRFRGDGRKYRVVCNTASYNDDTRYYDAYAYPLYTTGGPYWQTVRIPFSKFILGYKGLIQDDQTGLDSATIKFVAICLEDFVDGPFALEIDYLGLLLETRPFVELTAYETYAFPHIKYKRLQVGCDPPEQTG